MAEKYPRRPAFHANRLVRLLNKTCTANEIGVEACWLVTTIALVEDSKRYSGPVTFWTGQLLPVTGLASWDRMDRARKRAVAAGWLHYEAGAKGRAAKYWTLIPDHIQDCQNDSPVDDNIPNTAFIHPQNTDGNLIETGSIPDQSLIETGSKHGTSIPIPKPIPTIAKTTSSLVRFCHLWNEWNVSGIVAKRIRNADKPGRGLQAAWNRGQRDPEQKSRLSNLESIRTAIVAANGFLFSAGWFDAVALVGGKNSDRRFYCEMLMNGVYSSSTSTTEDFESVRQTIVTTYSPDLKNAADLKEKLTVEEFAAASKVGLARIANSRPPYTGLATEFTTARRAIV